MRENTFDDRINEAKKLKMDKGERRYGILNLKTDPRDFVDEALSELIDCLNYLELAMLQGKLPFCKWAAVDREVRFTIWRLGEGTDGRD